MIRRNEFNKILQLIDAGILSSNNELVNLIDSLPPIVDNELFIYEKQTDSTNNVNHTIDNNLVSLTDYINDLNLLQSLKIGKNKFQISWALNFNGVDITIENTIINSLEMTNVSLTTIDEINAFLTKEFNSIKTFINSPTKATKDNLVTSLLFNNPNQNLEVYYNKYPESYSSLITSTSWNFNYSIKLICKKVV